MTCHVCGLVALTKLGPAAWGAKTWLLVAPWLLATPGHNIHLRTHTPSLPEGHVHVTARLCKGPRAMLMLHQLSMFNTMGVNKRSVKHWGKGGSGCSKLNFTYHVCGLMLPTKLGPAVWGAKAGLLVAPWLLAALVYDIDLHIHSRAAPRCAAYKSCSYCGHSCTPHQKCWGTCCTHCSLACTGAPMQRHSVPKRCSCCLAERSQSHSACNMRVCGAQAGTSGARHARGPVLPAEKRRTHAFKVVMCLLLAALYLAAGLAQHHLRNAYLPLNINFFAWRPVWRPATLVSMTPGAPA